jgi:hypothetical protein
MDQRAGHFLANPVPEICPKQVFSFQRSLGTKAGRAPLRPPVPFKIFHKAERVL